MANKVYIDTTAFHIRRNHTDWLNLFELNKIAKFDERCEWYFPKSRFHSIRTNTRFLLDHLFAKLNQRGLSLPQLLNPYAGSLSASELRRSQCNVIYSHSGFPTNHGEIPVVWRNSILDPQMQKNWGVTDAQLALEGRIKAPLFLKSYLVHVSTAAEVERLGKQFPSSKEKFRSIPYFLPHLDSEISMESLIAKHQKKPLRIVYVGRYAHRKGLDLLIQAAEILKLGSRQDVELVIVCASPERIGSIPNWKNVVYHRSLDRAQTLQLMRNSHVFVMPSRFESYGIVYIEAMANGAVPVVPNWEVQRELVANGNAGVIIDDLSPASVAKAVGCLIDNDKLRLNLAINAHERFVREYHPRVVAQRFVEMMLEAL